MTTEEIRDILHQFVDQWADNVDIDIPSGYYRFKTDIEIKDRKVTLLDTVIKRRKPILKVIK